MVEVLYFANIRDITEKISENISPQNNTVRELVQQLIKIYPKNSSLKSGISIAINHKMIPKNEYESLKLLESDTIAFLTPVSGG